MCLFIYLEGRILERGGQTASTFQMATVVRVGPVQSQEPGGSFGSSVRVQRPKDLGYLPLVSQTISRELNRKWSSWYLNW